MSAANDLNLDTNDDARALWAQPNVSGLGPLRRGDRVAMICVSGPAKPEDIDSAEALLREWGLEPVRGAHLSDVHPRAAYLAGTDQGRAEDFQWAWTDESIAGIFMVRGGYGAIRVLDLLDVAALRVAPPKPLYGSSDVTALHEFLGQEVGVGSWFTPMLAMRSILDDDAALSNLHQAVFEPRQGRVFTAPQAQTLVPGVAEGSLVGGNLSLLCMSMGAKGLAKPSNAGKIVLLEEVNEETYRVDGFLQNLLRAGYFDSIAGIALGSWQGCSELAEIKALCSELLGGLGVPMIWELGFGHGPAAQSLPLGARARLVASERPELVLL